MHGDANGGRRDGASKASPSDVRAYILNMIGAQTIVTRRGFR